MYSECDKYKSIKYVINKYVNYNKNGLTIFSQWSKIVGKELANLCELIDIQDDTMVVQVRHGGVSQQIMLSKNKILKNINKLYPELKITQIKIKLFR